MVIDTKNRTRLPVAYKIEDYGKIILELNLSDNKKFYEIKIGKGKTLRIIQDKNINEITYLKNSIEIYSWTDKIVNSTELIRKIKEKTIYFKDDNVVMWALNRIFKPIKKLLRVKNSKLNNDFITADIETIVKDGVHIPYLISFYDGKTSKSFFNKDPNKLVKDFIDNLFIKINNRKFVYFHNFAGFDVCFIIKILVEYTKVKPLIHSGQFISIEAKYNDVKIIFRDSYKHLPTSLDKLANNFGVENKGIFPYFLNNLDYKDSFPDYKYFDNNKVPLDLYKKVKKDFTKKNKIWNFKEESIKYCIQDCKSLHQVISKYNELFFRNFSFNIHKYPTLPSLAFANFRANFMKKENVANITGKVYKEIRLSYTGGSTDIYIPKPSDGIKIHAYDVNSLYPFVMLDNEYPIGNPTYFVGDISNNYTSLSIENNLYSKSKPFGFFYCKITAPKNLLHPILQIHYKTKDGMRTISPLGKFEGMFFSEELYNAENYGYKFEVLWGYTFEKANIFKDYVDTLYNLRLKYPKDDPMNYITKLHLNSISGRFGMSDNLGQIAIINKEEFLFDNTTVKDMIDLGSNIILSYKKENYELETEESHSNANIAVASAITAYARIHMSFFKNNPNYPNLYYSDTDSLYMDGALPEDLVSQTEMGKMKLEGLYDEAVFLSPKVYALKNKNSEIIKIRGLTKEAILNNHIDLEVLKLLLNKDYKLSFNQNKWFKSLSKANIQILDQLYTLQVTSSKRDLIYNNLDKLIGTKAIIL